MPTNQSKTWVVVVISLIIGILLVPIAVNQVQRVNNEIATTKNSTWVTLDGLTEDAEWYNNTKGASYGAVRNSTAADVVNYTGNAMHIGQNISGAPTNYTIYRSAVFFNLSKISNKLEGNNITYVPSGEDNEFAGDIYDANLTLNLDSNDAVSDFNITIQYDPDNLKPNWTLINSGSPNASDYYYELYEGNLGYFASSDLPAVGNDFNISMVDPAFSYMENNKGEIIRYMLRSGEDINNDANTDKEFIAVHQQDDTGTTTPKLHLKVSYWQETGGWSFTGGQGAQTLFMLLPFLLIIGIVVYYIKQLL